MLAEQIARQGLTEETANKVQFGMQLAHAAGYKYGDAGMAGYTAQYAMNLMPAQMMQAQSTFQNIGSFVGLAMQTGINLPWLNPQFLTNLDKGSQWTMAQIGSGNPLQVSRMAQLQLMNGEGCVGDAMSSGTVGDAAQKSRITNSIIGALERFTGRNFRGEKLDDWRRAAKIASTDDIRSTITLESTGLPVHVYPRIHRRRQRHVLEPGRLRQGAGEDWVQSGRPVESSAVFRTGAVRSPRWRISNGAAARLSVAAVPVQRPVVSAID